MSDEQGYRAGCGDGCPECGRGITFGCYGCALEAERARSKALAEALREVLDAGDASVTATDDVASMLRFGDAVNAARSLLAQGKP